MKARTPSVPSPPPRPRRGATISASSAEIPRLPPCEGLPESSAASFDVVVVLLILSVCVCACVSCWDDASHSVQVPESTYGSPGGSRDTKMKSRRWNNKLEGTRRGENTAVDEGLTTPGGGRRHSRCPGSGTALCDLGDLCCVLPTLKNRGR